MGIVKAVWWNPIENTVALVTDIGVIPFVDEGLDVTQDTIDGFEKGTHKLDKRWSILDDSEKADFVDVSKDFFLQEDL